MIFIKSKYGKHAKVSENGYLYTFQRDSITGYSIYLCDQRKKNDGCHCKVNCWPGQNNLEIVVPHNHGPSEARVQAEIVKSNLYHKAETEKLRLPRDLISDAVAQAVGDEVNRLIPAIPSLAKTVQSRARKNTPELKEANTLRDLNSNPIRDVRCANGQTILWHDSGYTEQGRFLVFSTNQNVQRLREAKILAVDGTFSIVPRHFIQVWVLYGWNRSKFVPLAFATCSAKTTEMYMAILITFGQLNAQIAVMDFERAQALAFERIIVGIRIVGCHFHMSQAISNQWRLCGILKRYLNSNPELKLRLYRFRYIGFVKEEDRDDCFVDLLEDLKRLAQQKLGTEQRRYLWDPAMEKVLQVFGDFRWESVMSSRFLTRNGLMQKIQKRQKWLVLSLMNFFE